MLRENEASAVGRVEVPRLVTRMDWSWPIMIYREEGGRRLSKRPSEEDMWEATPVSSTQVVAPGEEAGDEGPFKCRAHHGGGELCGRKGRENLWSLPKDTLPALGWRLQLMLRPSTNTGADEQSGPMRRVGGSQEQRKEKHESHGERRSRG